jgi:hypothetical protein
MTFPTIESFTFIGLVVLVVLEERYLFYHVSWMNLDIGAAAWPSSVQEVDY